MRIESLHFKNITEGWELSETKFDDLNLLVGVSGAGKTQILEAIRTVQKIAQSDEGIFQGSWKLNFEIEGKRYIWEGESNSGLGVWIGSDQEVEQEFFWIKNEKLSSGGELIFERTPTQTVFKGNEVIGLGDDLSLMEHFHGDDEIKKIHTNFSMLRHSSISHFHGVTGNAISSSLVKNWLKDFKLDDLKQKKLPIVWKLFIVQEKCPEVFKEISLIFRDIFKETENIKIELEMFSEFSSNQAYPQIQFKIGECVVPQNRISSGMMKTFLFISEVHLAPNGSVFLVDEFENSLGINCLDVVTDQLFGSRDLQFIITSHHPYVINNIPMEYWKVVTRKGGVIQTHSAEDLKLGRSKHKAFTELINSKEYRKGVAA